MTFQDLKSNMLEEMILKLSYYRKPFKVHTDTLDFVIGGVLTQEGHPMAHESRKLNKTKK